MKIHAHHGPTGKIHSVFAYDGPLEIRMMLTPKPGVMVSELMGLNVPAGQGRVDALRRIAQTHKVPPQVATRNATKKQAKKR